MIIRVGKALTKGIAKGFDQKLYDGILFVSSRFLSRIYHERRFRYNTKLFRSEELLPQ